MALHEQHIPPNLRRELCSRLTYFDRVQPLKYKLYDNDTSSDPGAVAAIDQLKSSLFNLIIQEELAVSDLSCNESFLTRVLLRLGRAAESQLERHPTLLADLKTVLQQQIVGISCTNCNSISSGLPMEDVVGGTGCCITSLRQIFNAASETATRYYSEFTTVDPASFPAVVFCTQHVRDRNNLHELPIPYAITGSTTPCTQIQQYWSEVRLKLCVPEFDFDSYMAVPYILFHECIVHAFQDILPSCENRTASEPDDGFMEGWMDYLSFRLIQEVIAGRGPARDFGRSGLINPEHGTRAAGLYQSRINLEVSPAGKVSRYACYRRAGTEAADKVLHVLERLPKSGHNPWEAFLRMSLSLNLLQTFTPFHRKKFIGILSNLSRRGQLESDRQNEIVLVIKRYVQHLDVSLLVSEILDLPVVWGQKRAITGPLPLRQRPLINKLKRTEIH